MESNAKRTLYFNDPKAERSLLSAKLAESMNSQVQYAGLQSKGVKVCV